MLESQGENNLWLGNHQAMAQQPDKFRSQISQLADDVQRWAEANEWVTKKYPKRMRDTENQVFEITALFLQRGPIRLLLDPVAYDVPGSEATVDLYLMPTYDDMASLTYRDGSWQIRYPADANSSTTPPWDTASVTLNESTIIHVLNAIAAHAVPSF